MYDDLDCLSYLHAVGVFCVIIRTGSIWWFEWLHTTYRYLMEDQKIMSDLVFYIIGVAPITQLRVGLIKK